MANHSTFQDHLRRIETEIYQDDVIQRNPSTKWFKLGDATTAQVADLVTQFSVFSNHFIPLEAKRMINAATERVVQRTKKEKRKIERSKFTTRSGDG